MKKSKEETIIDFLNCVEQLKSTLRHNWTKAGRQESSAEHTWRIAIFFLLVQDFYGLDVDYIKTIKMILIHDIPEIVDGDIPAFIRDVPGGKFYKTIENENAKTVFSALPEPFSTEYSDLYFEFEKGDTKEAKLAQALDKIESQLQHLNSGSSYWTKEEIGDHMLNYPNKALSKLKDTRIQKIWDLIKNDLEKLTKELKSKQSD